ncbi:MAG: hypothetical protein Q7R35_04880 [Elusimicrobiota bacterium]|nr:hypothetical protein [Elusimicrobiota bacterium]
MKDLRVLMEEKEYTEAILKMKNIAPSERTEEWKNMALTAATALVEKELDKPRGGGSAYHLSKNLATGFAFLEENGNFKKVMIKAGLSAIKARDFYDRSEIEDIAAVLVKIDPASIYSLVLDSGYEDIDRKFMQYLDDNSAAYLKDVKVRKFLLSAVKENLTRDADEVPGLKRSVMNKYKLTDDLVKELSAEIKRISSEAVKGVVPNGGSGLGVLLTMNTLGLPIEGPDFAAYILSRFIVAVNTHKNILPYLEKLSSRDLSAGAKALLAAVPERPFWFSGSGWDQDNKADLVRKYLKEVLPAAKKECEVYEKDSQLVPKHVAYNYDWVKAL